MARASKEVQIDVQRMLYLIRRLYKEKMKTNRY